MNLKVDSPLIQAGIKVTNLLILNIYWIIGCLPLITIGTSTIAAFTVCEKMAEDREGIGMTREFWGAYKENLKNGIPVTLLFAVGAYATWFNFQLFNQLPDNPIWFLIFAILLIVIMVLHGLYLFALEARYENTLRGSLINARLIFFRFFPRTLALAGILFIQWLLFFQTSSVLIYVGIFCAPILMIYTTCQISMPIFRKLEKDSCANETLSVSGDNN